MRTIWTPSYPFEIPLATASPSKSFRCPQCPHRTQLLESSKTMNPDSWKTMCSVAAKT